MKQFFQRTATCAKCSCAFVFSREIDINFTAPLESFEKLFARFWCPGCGEEIHGNGTQDTAQQPTGENI
jgi:hypothetical protein